MTLLGVPSRNNDDRHDSEKEGEDEKARWMVGTTAKTMVRMRR